MTARTSVITDWRTREEDLPDVPPGEEYERVIVPQKFVVLCRILVHGVSLVRLQIGAVEIPFRLSSEDVFAADPSETGLRRIYRLKVAVKGMPAEKLVAIGARVVAPGEIAISPGLEVHMYLRNETEASFKPRAALLVEEEIT